MLRANHYDCAFESYLRTCRVPYVAVNETKRAVLPETSLKSLDFLVNAVPGQTWLVDVKGRIGPKLQGIGENWVTADDLESLGEWQKIFGASARALIVFAYWKPAPFPGTDSTSLFFDQGRWYDFFGVWADEYRVGVQVRSPSWGTVGLRRAAYSRLRFPLTNLLAPVTQERSL